MPFSQAELSGWLRRTRKKHGFLLLPSLAEPEAAALDTLPCVSGTVVSLNSTWQLDRAAS